MTVPGPYAAALLRRVRAWNVSAWRHGGREAGARPALDALSRLAEHADGQPRPPVPDAGLHALPDQLEVLIGDALFAGATQHDVDEVLRQLATDLRLRLS